jgi:hypothetical protein
MPLPTMPIFIAKDVLVLMIRGVASESTPTSVHRAAWKCDWPLPAIDWFFFPVTARRILGHAAQTAKYATRGANRIDLGSARLSAPSA